MFVDLTRRLFVPDMYVEQTICENREKRRRSAKRNYQRMMYELAENGCTERFGDLLDDEIRKIRKFDRGFSGVYQE